MKDFLYPASIPTIAYQREGRRRRASSYDRRGGNDDRVHIAPGETLTLASLNGPGMITHIWMTIATDSREREQDYLRKMTMRMFWDDEKTPSVEAPVGDFFGMGHGMTRNFVSAPLQMSPEDGKGFNCWFPMPFESAVLTMENECREDMTVYFYVDYEAYRALPEGLLRFHAQFRRENPTDGIPDGGMSNREWLFGGENRTGAGNYVILDALGRGHYVGCNLNIHNFRDTAQWDWPGEGDDMIFIDGEEWPPELHGTGTEDYVNMAWCPTQTYSAPYHGIIAPGGENWKDKLTYYRYHIQDPVMFEKSIRVTMEHGHANRRSDDWSSTAYWYQTEPHAPFPAYPTLAERLPIHRETL